nr:reverse transcriptase domain-containing protein [Tanacetum cinerariifolium]
MMGPTPDLVTPLNQVVENNNQNIPSSLQDQILSHMSSLEALIKQHNEKGGTPIVTPIRLTFHDDGDWGKGKDSDQSPKDGGDEDLKKPYKEVLKSPFTRRIIDFSAPSHQIPINLKIYDGSIDPDDHITHFVSAANQGEWEMSVCCRMFQQTLDRPARGWFDSMPNGCIDSWADLCERVSERFSLRRRCSKDPTRSRRSSEGPMRRCQILQSAGPKRWVTFRAFQKVDDFVKFEEAYKSTEFPKGEQPERGHGTTLKGGRPARLGHGNGHQKTDIYGRRDHYQLYVPPRAQNWRYYDYHGEKGHYTNDCYHLKMQLEAALESGKLNHLVKDVRHRGNNRGRQPGNNNEAWMNVPITFPSIIADDVSDEPLITEAEVEELVGFPGEQLIPIRNVELGVKFEGGGLFRKTILKFTMVRASSPYNIILGRTRMRELMAVSSIIYGMVKFPTPKGIATLIAQTTSIYECRWSKKDSKARRIDRSEGTERAECRERLINMLKNNMDVFAWQPSDMIGVPRRVIKHALNVNVSVTLVAHNRRVLGTEKSRALIKDVEEWVKARIIRQGTYCYTKMPFVLKNAGATYQWLVAMAFQTQLGINLEEYVDSMVIKSKTDQGMIMYIAETFENLQKINMKLNPKKCSFGVGEGKFLDYMVTSEGIRANPKKMKAVADMQSPKTLKEIQSLRTEKAHTGVTNAHYLEPKEILYVYLAASCDAVSSVLVADRKGKQTPIWYVRRTLHEAEWNYAPLEKLALCLLHLSRRLHRYFKAYPIRVITNYPIKQILNKPEVSRKLVKYAIELGAYNITYVPRNAVKGQVLADFINEILVGTKYLEICSLTNSENFEEWTLYTDGASSLKGVGTGLVLIDLAEYEALLAGLRITRKMKVHALKEKVDSKLVSCQMNGEFVASSEGMEKYLTKANEYAALFKRFLIENISRNQNQEAYVLRKLASVAFNHLTKEILVEVLNTKFVDTQEVNTIMEEEEDN